MICTREFSQFYLKFSWYLKYLADMKVPFKLIPGEVPRNTGSMSSISQQGKLVEPIIKHILISPLVNLTT